MCVCITLIGRQSQEAVCHYGLLLAASSNMCVCVCVCHMCFVWFCLWLSTFSSSRGLWGVLCLNPNTMSFQISLLLIITCVFYKLTDIPVGETSEAIGVNTQRDTRRAGALMANTDGLFGASAGEFTRHVTGWPHGRDATINSEELFLQLEVLTSSECNNQHSLSVRLNNYGPWI